MVRLAWGLGSRNILERTMPEPPVGMPRVGALPNPRAPSTYMVLTLGAKVHKCDLLWPFGASWKAVSLALTIQRTHNKESAAQPVVDVIAAGGGT